MCFRGFHGSTAGVVLSPSIKYCSHPRYSKPVKLDLNESRQRAWTSKFIDEFGKYDGKWVQCAFMCRVKPGSYEKFRETIGLGHNGKFDNIDKNEIEWVVNGNQGQIIGPEKILIYGIMIRTRDTEPTDFDGY